MKIRTLTAFQPLRAKPLLCGFLSLALWGLLAGMPQAIPLAIGQAQANPEPGQPAPGFFLFDIHGQEHFLSDYVGKPRGSFGKAPPRQPVLLNFFGVAIVRLARAAFRDSNPPDHRADDLGFCLVRGQ